MQAIQMNHMQKIKQLLSIALLCYTESVHAIKSTGDHVKVLYTIWKNLTQKTLDKNKVCKG